MSKKLLPKKLLFALPLLVCIVLAIFPAKYIYQSIQKTLAIGKLRSITKGFQTGSEYIAFTNMHLEGIQTFNQSKYFVKLSIAKTHGIAELQRNNQKQMLFSNAEFENVDGNFHSIETQNIYHVISKFVKVEESSSIVTMYGNFTLSVLISKNAQALNMAGKNLVMNFTEKTIQSKEPVLFHTDDSFLIGGNFLYKNNRIEMTTNILLNSPQVRITSQQLNIMLGEDGDNFSFDEAVFSKNPIFFDKQTKAFAYAEKIIFNNKKKVAFLKGSAMIVSNSGIIKGENMEYIIGEGFAKVEGQSLNDVNSPVEVHFQY